MVISVAIRMIYCSSLNTRKGTPRIDGIFGVNFYLFEVRLFIQSILAPPMLFLLQFYNVAKMILVTASVQLSWEILSSKVYLLALYCCVNKKSFDFRILQQCAYPRTRDFWQMSLVVAVIITSPFIICCTVLV